MKKNIIFNMGIAILACLPLQNKVFAQPPATVPPANPDNFILNNGEPINTAMIYYCYLDKCPVNQVVWGIAWDGASPVYVKDEGTGLFATCPAAGGGTPPDVVIGNDLANPGNFIMALAYYDYSGHAVVDFYEITGAGTAFLAVNYVARSSMPVPGGFQFNTVHIDLIAEHSVLPVLPVCNKFILTSDNLSTGRICATNGDLTSHTVNPIPAAFNGFVAGSQPDVAAIQRMIGSSVHDIGLIPCVDASNTQLLYTELDFTTGTILTGPVVKDFIPGSTFVVPRIDAIDDYVTNAIPTIAQYKIAAAINTGSASDIRTYDNVCPMFQSALLLTVPGYIGPLNNYSPVVAVSGPQNYSVYHWTEEVTGVGPNKYLSVLDPIARTPCATLSPNNYFWVNSLGGALVSTALVWIPGTWRISVSSCVNYNSVPGALNLFAWGQEGLSGPITEYKLSGSPSFAFREGSIPSFVTNVQQHSWALYPNPAVNELNITNATGNTAATTYHIVDVKGSEVLHGNITGGSTTISIGELVPGNYLVMLLNDKGVCEKMKFIKE